MKRALLLVLLVLLIAAGIAWRILRGPDAEAILASIELVPAPVLSAADEFTTFRTAPGYRVELVAAEPLVVDPVAMDWDDQGRLYVVEMRGFMPDIDGNGEDEPVGRVVVLEDTDADGEMDRSDVYLDGLVMPRAVAVLPQGVLIGEPPHLWLCRDTTGDRACDQKQRVADYAALAGNPEHLENGLLAALDGWIYNSKSDRRFRFTDDDTLEVDRTVMRGQWGIAQDDAGRLYHNHNSGFLYVDEIPTDYLMRQASTASSLKKPGVNQRLSKDAQVFGVRVAPGLNRAYLEGTLRPDGRQNLPTGVSGLAVQRGDQYGPGAVGHAFIPESAGSVVARFAVHREKDGSLRGEHLLYPDETWEQREWLASTDERFRPVDADFGPDGAIWVIDMYRGVIQHAQYVSDHLREYATKQDLVPPGATGRIWRVVRKGRPLHYAPPPLASLEAQLAALDHPNGWVRDRATRRIVHTADPEAIAALRELGDFEPIGRRHALWALHHLGGLDPATWQLALGDRDPQVQLVALRVGERLFAEPALDAVAVIMPFLRHDLPEVRLQALHTLGTVPANRRPIEPFLRAGREGNRATVQAGIAGLVGLERRALREELERGSEASAEWLSALAAAAHLSAVASDGGAAVAELLDGIAALEDEARQAALLEGIVDAQGRPGGRVVELPEPHALFDPERDAGRDVASLLKRLRREFTWPGDPNPGGARPLSPEDEERRAAGEALFAVTCAGCHGENGRGQEGLAPTLAGSPWVRDSDDWLVRIAFHGVTGPIEVAGETWNSTMPGHIHDPRFDDDAVAGLLTYLRRSWGHAEDPVQPDTVAGIRALVQDRGHPWTSEELRSLPITHRLDRYTGSYEIPLVGISLEVRREHSTLMMGRAGGGSAPLAEIGGGVFVGEGMTIEFEAEDDGSVEGASVEREGTTFPISRKG